MLLGQIKQVTRDTQLKPEDETTIKDVFKNILSSGDNYDLSEIEKWVNTITKSQSIVDRIMNIAHYQKIKHETNNRLKIMPDGCGCCGNC